MAHQKDGRKKPGFVPQQTAAKQGTANTKKRTKAFKKSGRPKRGETVRVGVLPFVSECHCGGATCITCIIKRGDAENRRRINANRYY